MTSEKYKKCHRNSDSQQGHAERILATLRAQKAGLCGMAVGEKKRGILRNRDYE